MSTRRLVLFLVVAAAPLLLALQPRPPQSAPASSLVTLRAFDDLAATFDFDTGIHGVRVTDGELVIDDSDIAFGVFASDRLSFGYRYRERTRILDLGDLRTPAADRPVTIPARPDISVLNTLFIAEGKVLHTLPTGRVVPLVEGKPILGPVSEEGTQHIVPQLGHVYMLRYKTRDDGTKLGCIVVFRVVDIVPGVSVTLRWAKLV